MALRYWTVGRLTGLKKASPLLWNGTESDITRSQKFTQDYQLWQSTRYVSQLHQKPPRLVSKRPQAGSGVTHRLQPARYKSLSPPIVGSDNHVHSPRPSIPVPTLSLGQYLMERLETFQNLEAVVDLPTGRRLTFLELRDVSVRVASGLAKLGLRKGDVVFVCATNCLEYVVLCVALMSMGAILSPVNPSSTIDVLARQLALSGAVAVVAHDASTADIDTASAANPAVQTKVCIGEAHGWYPFSGLMTDDGRSYSPAEDVTPAEDVAFLPYSSGTTGLPKGVMLTHTNVLVNMLQFGQCCPAIAGEDRVLGYLPFSHIYGLSLKMLYCISGGACLVIMSQVGDSMLDIVQRQRITIFHMVPPICIQVIKHPDVRKYDLSVVRWAMCGAAPLGKEQVEMFQHVTGVHRIFQAYGLTETSPAATIDSHPARVGSVGQPVPNTVIKIADVKTGESLGPGQDGEVHVFGPQVMAGYLGNPTATADTIRDGWLLSGDVGHYDSDGYIYITDRVKELIKYKGFQVAPAELEALLVTHPAVQSAAVIGVPDEAAGEVPRAYIVRSPGADWEVQPKDIEKYVNDRVASHAKLRGGIEIVDEIPKSPSGKILRRVLKARDR